MNRLVVGFEISNQPSKLNLKSSPLVGFFFRTHPRHFCGVARVSRALSRHSRALSLPRGMEKEFYPSILELELQTRTFISSSSPKTFTFNEIKKVVTFFEVVRS
jgi:hypothetical protein